MCGPYFNFAARQASEYHVHIYFEAGKDSEWQADLLAMDLQILFRKDVSDLHRVGKIGPHTQNNISLDITPESFGKVVAWLQLVNPGLSILVHPRTGDEVFDHKKAALWLGQPVAFNERFFEAISTPKKIANGPKR